MRISVAVTGVRQKAQEQNNQRPFYVQDLGIATLCAFLKNHFKMVDCSL